MPKKQPMREQTPQEKFYMEASIRLEEYRQKSNSIYTKICKIEQRDMLCPSLDNLYKHFHDVLDEVEMFVELVYPLTYNDQYN